MRKIFTLSMVALSMGSLIAQPMATKFNGAEKNFTNLLHAKSIDRSQSKAVSMQLGMYDMTSDKQMSADKKPAAGTVAFYDRGTTLEMGIFFYEGNSGAGWYSYNTPYLYAQAYEAELVSRPGNTWNAYTSAGLGENIDDEVVNDSILAYALPSGGGYYAPVVSNGFASYFYGQTGTESQYAVIWSASMDEEPVAVGAHNSNDQEAFYGTLRLTSAELGVMDTIYEYGSMNARNAGWFSDQMVIDYGTMHGFVLQGIEAWAISTLGDTPAFPEGGELKATLTVTNGDDVTTYTSVITAENYDADGQHLSFEFYDVVDGFEAAITPILDGEVVLSITGFSTVNLGIVAAAMPEELSDDADYHVSSYYVADRGDGPKLYYWLGMDAVVNLLGNYNFVGEYATGAHYVEGEIPVEGGYAISEYDEEDGEGYYDFDIECVWGIDDLQLVEAPDFLAAIEYDDSYFEQAGVVMFFFTAEALPEGVSGREGDVVIETLDGASRVTIHLVQGTPAPSGIESVVAEKAKSNVIYDLYGRQLKSVAEGQLYIQNGKVIRK